MSDALMVRGMVEIRRDRDAASVVPLDVVGITVSGGRLVLHTERGTAMAVEEYRAEKECCSSYGGFAFTFALETEDALTALKITALRLKYRMAAVRPKTNTDFCLCVLIHAVETLPLTRHTLRGLVPFLERIRTNTPLPSAMRTSCLRLVHAAMYLFFDETGAGTLAHVPRVFVLHKEARRARATCVRALFGPPSRGDSVSLSFAARRTQDGRTVESVMNDVLAEEGRAFYVPIAMSEGSRVDGWLCNEPTSRSAA